MTPIIIVLFLRYFGDNKFEIPVYYESDLPDVDCNVNYTSPYSLSQTEILNQLLAKGEINLFGLIDSLNFSLKTEYLNEVIRRNSEGANFNFLIFSEKLFNLDGVQVVVKNKDELLNIGTCELLLSGEVGNEEDPLNFITLIDKNGRIRGYFKIGDLDELDRLLVEIDILNKNG